MQQILEGSRAIALTIKAIAPDVVSAYPITPQTHIVEDLAKFKAEGQAGYEYIRAESEFAAASIVAGASAAGSRVYTATSSQGLLLMTEILFNIAGMRLPVVLTCANRAVSAPISIWNDHQDAMTLRDAGWIMLFAETHEEAVSQHLLAYKVAEQVKLPVMVNVDGFVLTHSYEPVRLIDPKVIKKFLPKYKPAKGEYLDPKNPVTMGPVAFPAHYFEIRQGLHEDLVKAEKVIKEESAKLKALLAYPATGQKAEIDNGILEFTGPRRAKTVIVAMGSVAGTVKHALAKQNGRPSLFADSAAVLKLRCFRPFPADEIISALRYAKRVVVLEKAISLGSIGPLALEIRSALSGRSKAEVISGIAGLGGRDITGKTINEMIKKDKKKNVIKFFS